MKIYHSMHNSQCTMHNEGGGLRPRILKAAAKGFGGDRKAPRKPGENQFRGLQPSFARITGFYICLTPKAKLVSKPVSRPISGALRSPPNPFATHTLQSSKFQFITAAQNQKAIPHINGIAFFILSISKQAAYLTYALTISAIYA